MAFLRTPPQPIHVDMDPCNGRYEYTFVFDAQSLDPLTELQVRDFKKFLLEQQDSAICRITSPKHGLGLRVTLWRNQDDLVDAQEALDRYSSRAYAALLRHHDMRMRARARNAAARRRPRRAYAGET